MERYTGANAGEQLHAGEKDSFSSQAIDTWYEELLIRDPTLFLPIIGLRRLNTALLQDGMDSLSQEQQETLLVYIDSMRQEGSTRDQIAQRFGISEDIVGQHLSRNIHGLLDPLKQVIKHINAIDTGELTIEYNVLKRIVIQQQASVEGEIDYKKNMWMELLSGSYAVIIELVQRGLTNADIGARLRKPEYWVQKRLTEIREFGFLPKKDRFRWNPQKRSEQDKRDFWIALYRDTQGMGTTDIARKLGISIGEVVWSLKRLEAQGGIITIVKPRETQKELERQESRLSEQYEQLKHRLRNEQIAERMGVTLGSLYRTIRRLREKNAISREKKPSGTHLSREE